MSAWVHGKDHIDLLVSAAVEGDVTIMAQGDNEALTRSGIEGGYRAAYANRLLSPSELGRVLIRENVRSVLHRYEDIEGDELAEYMGLISDYAHEPVDLSSVPNAHGVVLKALASFDYQSCETEDYEVSEAALWINSIRAWASSKFYAEEGWSFTRTPATTRR